MCPQIACQRGCIITLVAFVRFFSTVCFRMCPQMICARGCIIALVAFLWFFLVDIDNPPSEILLHGIIMLKTLFHRHQEGRFVPCRCWVKTKKNQTENLRIENESEIYFWNDCEIQKEFLPDGNHVSSSYQTYHICHKNHLIGVDLK